VCRHPQSAPEELNEPTLYDFLLGEIACSAATSPWRRKLTWTLQNARAIRASRAAPSRWRISRACRTWRSSGEDLLDIEPSSPQALQVTAALLIGSKRVEEAEPYLEKLLSADGVNLENGFMQIGRLLAATRTRAPTCASCGSSRPSIRSLRRRNSPSRRRTRGGRRRRGARRGARRRRMRPEWEPPAVLEAQVLQKRSPAAAAKRLEAFVAKNPARAKAG